MNELIATPGPGALSPVTVLKVCAVMSVKAMITYTSASQTKTRYNICDLRDM